MREFIIFVCFFKQILKINHLCFILIFVKVLLEVGVLDIKFINDKVVKKILTSERSENREYLIRIIIHI